MIDVSNPAALKSIELSDDSGSDRGWKIRQTQPEDPNGPSS